MTGGFPEQPVLLVDDEQDVLSSESKVLRSAGITNILTCQDPREVMPLLAGTPVDVILLDITMPHIPGDRLLEQIRDRHPDIPVIIVTASAEIDVAVQCMKSGAFDYMVKAVEPSRLVSGVRRAADLQRLTRKYAALRTRILAEELEHPEAFAKLVTANRRMRSLFALVEALAPTDETLLVTGETGTGKELLAEAIHRAGGRKGELVTVNAAGLDDTMFADALFGHRKGAFTGADADRKGLLQQAEGGTLFLDEIGDLSAQSQIKLLRLIERHEFYPLGSDLVRVTGARFVLATNQPLPQLVASGSFRRDLYYRLQTHEIRLPPLRERRDDLPLLLEHFLDEACERLGRKKLAVPPELLTLLEAYHFPGNVRELRSMVLGAVSRQKEKMLSLATFREAMGRDAETVEGEVSGTGQLSFPPRLPTLRDATEALIREALDRSKGNQAIAAGLLGISPQALSKRLKRRGEREET